MEWRGQWPRQLSQEELDAGTVVFSCTETFGSAETDANLRASTQVRFFEGAYNDAVEPPWQCLDSRQNLMRIPSKIAHVLMWQMDWPESPCRVHINWIGIRALLPSSWSLGELPIRQFRRRLLETLKKPRRAAPAELQRLLELLGKYRLRICIVDGHPTEEHTRVLVLGAFDLALLAGDGTLCRVCACLCEDNLCEPISNDLCNPDIFRSLRHFGDPDSFEERKIARGECPLRAEGLQRLRRALRHSQAYHGFDMGRTLELGMRCCRRLTTKPHLQRTMLRSLRRLLTTWEHATGKREPLQTKWFFVIRRCGLGRPGLRTAVLEELLGLAARAGFSLSTCTPMTPAEAALFCYSGPHCKMPSFACLDGLDEGHACSLLDLCLACGASPALIGRLVSSSPRRQLPAECSWVDTLAYQELPLETREPRRKARLAAALTASRVFFCLHLRPLLGSTCDCELVTSLILEACGHLPILGFVSPHQVR